MKTKSLTAMLMAMALSFNFAACSDDDENGGGGSGLEGASKRLKTIYVQAEWDTNNETVFQYDNEGRVTEMDITYDHHSSGDTWTDYYSYSYNGDEVTLDVDYAGDGPEYREQESYTYTLNDKGYVTEGAMNFSSGKRVRQYTFSYTDDYLIRVTEGYENETPRVVEHNQIISDGLILPHDGNSIEYTDIPNKGNLFFHYANEKDIFDSFEFCELYLTNLAGKAPKYLPERVDDWHFSYELDDEGYATEITITITNSHTTRPTIITCTYEEI